MGNRGPKPTPTAILEKQGSRETRGRKAEPRPPSSLPEKPSWLGEKASVFWDDLGPAMVSWRIMTELDGLAFGMLCESLERWLKYRDLATERGPITEGGNHIDIQDPAVGMENKAWDRLLKACREFGLSPSSRSALRIEGKPGGTKGGLAKFFTPKIADTG